MIERAGAEGAYRELAEEGLRQCGAAGPSPAPAAETAVIPVLPPGDADEVERLPATPWLVEEPQLVPAPGPAPALQREATTDVSTERLANQAAAGEAALEAGWLLVDLRG